MRMYWAIILAIATMFVWPDKNISDVPFSQLTLKMIGQTIFALYIGYLALKVWLSSLEKDKFWPWCWTKQIIKFLAARLAMLVSLGGIVYLFRDHKIMNYPIVVGIVVFLAVTSIVCISDDEMFGSKQNSDINE